MAKWFLSENEIIVNGEQDQRRGRKLRAGDQLEIKDMELIFLLVMIHRILSFTP